MRRSSAFLFAAVCLLGCKRDRAKPVEAVAAPAQGGGPRTLLPGATCEMPLRIDHDVTIKAGCVVDVTESAWVENGSTLTIEPGARLRFQPRTYLEIGHRGAKLIAKGSADKPIVFTSAAATPKRGDFIGLVLDDTIGESVLENAVIEYAGQQSHGGAGAVTIFRTTVSSVARARIALRNVTFRENDTAAISDPDGRATFTAFANNTFSHNARAMRVNASTLLSLGDANDIDDSIEVVGGTIEGRGTWPKTKSPVIITEPIYVNGKGDAVASLTIPRGTTLKMASKTWIEVGTAGPAELVVQGVTFTSAEATPRAGDWVGLVFGDKTRHASVTDSTIEYAGAEEHGGDAAVTFVGQKSWQALDVSFSAVTFRHIAQAHFSSNGDGCDKALDPKYGIGWAGNAEPCR